MNFLQLIAQQKKLLAIEKVIGSDDLRKLQSEIDAVATNFLNAHHPEYAAYLQTMHGLLYHRSKDEIAELDIYEDHHRPIEVVTDASMPATIKKLKKEKFLGFDTESKPVFEKGQTQTIAVIQISSQRVCYIFQLNSITYPAMLETIISDQSIKKIGVGLGSDMKSLREELQLKCEGFIDLNTIYEYLGRHNNIGSKQLVAAVLNKNLKKSKKVTISNWAATELSPEQLTYASDDAFSSLDAYLMLQKHLKEHEAYLQGKLMKLLDL